MLGFAIIGQALNCCNIINSDQGNSCITHNSSKKQSNAANGCKKDTSEVSGLCVFSELVGVPTDLTFQSGLGNLTSSENGL